MDKDLIYRNAETFEIGARDSLQEANRQIFKAADLLIKLAFAVGGLAATHIVSSPEKDLLFSKLGIVLLGFSIVAGGVQMMIDRRFFLSNARGLSLAADHWKCYGAQSDNENKRMEAYKMLDGVPSRGSSSSTHALLIAAVFAALGAISVLVDVL